MTNDATEPAIYDRDALAALMNVCPATLPEVLASGVEDEPPPTPQIDVMTEGFALTDEEWSLIKPLVPWHAYRTDDRLFLDSVLWRQRAKPSRGGWWYLPPTLGIVASVRGRFLRWSMQRHWESINEATQRLPLSEKRKADFAGIAAEAKRQREKVLDNRK